MTSASAFMAFNVSATFFKKSFFFIFIIYTTLYRSYDQQAAA
jgi:hypothetical protein